MADNKYVFVAIVILLLAVGFMAYWNYCSQPGTECPIPIAPTPTPTPTPGPTPTPTRTPISPTPTPGPGGIAFEDVSFEDSGGDDVTDSEVTTGTDITSVVTFTSDGSTEAYVKVEWVKDVSYAPDPVVDTAQGSVNFYDGKNDIEFGPFTDEEDTGNYFVRVYAGPSSDDLERVDPWTDPISNPDRPEVEFVEDTEPTPTPTPTPEPEATYEGTSFWSGSTVGERITVDVGSEVDIRNHIGAENNDIDGTLTVKLKKDIVGSSDVVVDTFTEDVSLDKAEDDWYGVGSFNANEETDDCWGCVRQYFIKAKYTYQDGSEEWIYDPTDPEIRAAVYTEAEEEPTPTPTPTPTPEQGELEHVRTDFTTSSGPTQLAERICVSDGTTVSVTEYVKAVDGDVSGTIDVKIRIDYAWSGDDEKESFSKYIEVEEGETEPIYMGQFTAEDEGSNFRQYFSKVWMDYTSGAIDLIYNPEDPDTREAVCVSPNCDPCN